MKIFLGACVQRPTYQTDHALTKHIGNFGCEFIHKQELNWAIEQF